MITLPSMRRSWIVCVIACCLPAGILPAVEFAGGVGEPTDPYQIATAEQLISIGSDPNLLDRHFVLVNDIDLDPNLPGGRVFTQAVIAPTAGGTDPNGDFQGTAFSGVFAGNDHTISNLTVHGTSHLGLFGLISGVVRNVALADVEIIGSGNGVGGLAGSSRGIVIECHSTGLVSGGSLVGGVAGQLVAGRVVRCYSSAMASGTGNSIGGLVGHSERGSVVMGFSTGDVHGHSYVGGLVGRSYEGAVVHSYSFGSVTGSMHIGGLIGQNWTGCVTHCYSVGGVGGESTFGGLLGSNVNAGRSPGVVRGCFWDIERSGQDASAAGTGKTTGQMQDLSTFLAAGWDFVDESLNGASDYWQMPAGEYPRLCCHAGDRPVMPEGSGTAEAPYLIRDAADLGVVWFEPAAHYRLEAAVDLSGIAWSVAVVPWFEGTFDGNGCVIRNLHIEGSGYLGLFGECGPAATILNLGLEAADVNGTGNYVGGLVGDNAGGIEACCTAGAIAGEWDVGGLVGNNRGSIIASHSTSVVTGRKYRVGGLAGCNYGSVATSYSAGAVKGDAHVGGLVGRCHREGSISESHSTAEVSGTSTYVGGLVGYNSGGIAGSHSTGKVIAKGYVGGLVGSNSGRVATSYSSSAVSGDQLVGGLAGLNDGSIRTSFSNGTVTGRWRVGGLAGLSGGDIAESYSHAAVTGEDDVGGLVGSNAGAQAGLAIRGSISMCYSVGLVNGDRSVGGLAGAAGPHGVTASFWDTGTSGQSTSVVGTGKTTAEMQAAGTFLDAGWDFQSIWMICEGGDYPRLRWEGRTCE